MRPEIKESLKQPFDPWMYELMVYTEKAQAVKLTWYRPWNLFIWLYWTTKASKCIPKKKHLAQ